MPLQIEGDTEVGMVFESPHPAVPVPDVSLSEYLFGSLGGREARPALVDAGSGQGLTYARIRDGAADTARGLAARGLKRGDRFAILSPNLPEYAIAFHGVAMAGGCSTTLNPLNTEDELVHQLGDSGARWVVTVPPLVERARAVAERTAIEEVFVFGEAEGATAFTELAGTSAGPAGTSGESGGGGVGFPGVEIDPAEDLITLPYSSGTTGKPKGVMLTHRNLVANVAQYLSADPVREDDVVLAVLPFFHIYGMVVMMSACLKAGATVITMPRFDLESFLSAIERYRVTRAYAVPPIVLALAKHPMVDDHDLSSLDYVMSGAAPLGADLALACRDRLGCVVFQGYGLTEASPVTHANSPGVPQDRLGTVGPSVPGTEVMVVDLESGRPLGPGREGEVWVRGPQVMKGYLNDPDATARTLDADGWLHTGDVGRVDSDGFLTVVDRAKELIKYKGFQVAPAELEDLLLSHPRIRDAAVIPSPEPECGEVPKAFLVTDGLGERDVAELERWVAGRVAPYKKIRRFEFVDSVPRSASGKILRRVLVEQERDRLAAGSAARGSP